MADLPKVVLQVWCENCQGTGRVKYESGVVGGVVIDPYKTCEICRGRGHYQGSVELAELKRWLDSLA